MKIGIIREGKNPPDARVPLTPMQCANLIHQKRLNLVVQTSPIRCYKDEEYSSLDVPVVADVADCDILLGVKEVPINQLIPNKTYLFFSHTIKKQAYNQQLLKNILAKNITLIDYEVLTNEKGQRVIAFGHFAGMVGAYNGLYTYGKRTETFDLKRMYQCHDYEEAAQQFKDLKLPPIKIVLTGTGRVAGGAVQVLKDMSIPQISPKVFLQKEFDHAVFTQLDCHHYVQRKNGADFNLHHFFKEPDQYKSIFAPYTKSADLMINGIYWDNKAPAFFTKQEMAAPSFKLKVIADVTCDIAPVSSIPSTLRATTIPDPVFGYDPKTTTETSPYQSNVIDMMTIDNLPNELPRDASKAFGEQFISSVLDDLLNPQSNGVTHRGTIAKRGKLTKLFSYLKDYANQ